MKLLGMTGSLRAGSYNVGLLKTIMERYEDKFHLEMEDISTLPFFNQDLESAPPQAVQQFKQNVQSADGVVIATPEYNWSVPGVLKNALDWLSRGERVLVDKPVLVVGASTGVVGTLRAQQHLRQILSSPGLSCRMLPPGGNEVLITFAEQKFDASVRLVDPSTLQFLDSVMDKFISLM